MADAGAMRAAWIGLGSNLEDPAAQLRRAICALRSDPAIRVLAVSSFYRSVPVGGPAGQPMFCNACAALATALMPLALLDRLQAIEAAQGRKRHVRWGARTLDLDILGLDSERLDLPRLTLPHPRAHERGFVLVPLAEIAPALVLGRAGRVADLRAAMDTSDVQPWHAP